MEKENLFFEQGPYRPPSEAYSLLIRVTRNCPWNRCEFCPAYKGSKFQFRTVEEIKREIQLIKEAVEEIRATIDDQREAGFNEKTVNILSNNYFPENLLGIASWLSRGGDRVFLQDADSLVMDTDGLVEILRFIKKNFPKVKRITSYARSRTILRKDIKELELLCRAGLSRLHIGLESGYDPLLKMMKKGITAKGHIEAGRMVREAGISLSEYVLLGLGGEEMSREHAEKTASVLNKIDPDYIRIRTLMVRKNTPLYSRMEEGAFNVLGEDSIIEEERILLENLDGIGSHLVSDHIRNLLGELEGDFPEDKKKVLAIIDRYRGLSPDEKLNFRLGRRAHIYQSLDNFFLPHLFGQVEKIRRHLISQGGVERVEEEIISLMSGVG